MASTLPISCQFQSGDWSYLSRAIPLAREYGASRVQFSHELIHRIEDLWNERVLLTGSSATTCRPDIVKGPRLPLVREALALAKSLGLKVDVWTHEISGVSDEDVAHWKGWTEIDGWLEAKYSRAFSLIPEVDGLVLTLAETELTVYGGKGAGGKKDLVALVPSLAEEPPSSRIAHVISTMLKIVHAAGKLLFVRSFVYEPAELEEFIRAVEPLREHPSLVFMSKCTPHDWQPYYPHASDIGRLPHPWVEIDLGDEYTGQSTVLRVQADYIAAIVKNALAKGAQGIVARVERFNNHVLGTPNEVNLYALQRLVHAPSLTAREVVLAWVEKRYGIKGEPAALLADALMRTYEIANRVLFPLETWVVNHSQFPSQSYIDRSLKERKTTKWIESPEIARKEALLERPTRETLELLDCQYDIAGRQLKASLADLSLIRAHLSSADYDELTKHLSLTWVNAFRLFHLSSFGMRYYRLLPADSLLREPLKRQILAHLAELRSLSADPWLISYIEKIYPCIPAGGVASLLTCCTEIEAFLE